MSGNDILEKVKSHLFNDDVFTYAIIDGAACPDLRFKVYDWEPQSACLWSGELAPDLQEVAPYMVLLDKKSLFTDWLIEEGWNNHWSIFVSTKLDFKGFRKQIRKLLLVKSPEGKNVVFRFYDPRVMDAFLPTLAENQTEEFFSGVTKFYYQKALTDSFMVSKINQDNGQVIVTEYE